METSAQSHQQRGKVSELALDTEQNKTTEVFQSVQSPGCARGTRTSCARSLAARVRSSSVEGAFFEQILQSSADVSSVNMILSAGLEWVGKPFLNKF
jgi:hypothetical protein